MIRSGRNEMSIECEKARALLVKITNRRDQAKRDFEFMNELVEMQANYLKQIEKARTHEKEK